VLGRGHDLPLVLRAREAKAGALVGRGKLRERGLDGARRPADDAPELVSRYGLLGDEEDGFDRVG